MNVRKYSVFFFVFFKTEAMAAQQQQQSQQVTAAALVGLNGGLNAWMKDCSCRLMFADILPATKLCVSRCRHIFTWDHSSTSLPPKKNFFLHTFRTYFTGVYLSLSGDHTHTFWYTYSPCNRLCARVVVRVCIFYCLSPLLGRDFHKIHFCFSHKRFYSRHIIMDNHNLLLCCCQFK